jgi:heme exporter protein C
LKKLHRFISVKYFDPFAARIIPALAIVVFVLCTYGCIGGLHFAPADYQQGDAFRIIYVHVPSAFLSVLIYLVAGIIAGIGLIFRIKLCDMFVLGSTHLGAWLTLLALITGCIWAKPMWGTWWVWDARLTSELILLFLYLGVIALRHALPEEETAAQASAVLLMLGLINLPIIHYSVYWWNTLHQGASIRIFSPSLISSAMLYPLLAMIIAFIGYYLLVVLLHVRCAILEQHVNAFNNVETDFGEAVYKDFA